MRLERIQKRNAHRDFRDFQEEVYEATHPYEFDEYLGELDEEDERYLGEREYRLYLLDVEADRITREEIQAANDTFVFDYHTRLLADDWEDPWDGEPAYPDEHPAYPSPNEIN